MRLSAKPIVAYQNINSFRFATEWTIRDGEANTLYFQLIDLDQEDLRYIPIDDDFEVSMEFPALDAAAVITKVGVTPSQLDRSVVAVTLNASDAVSSGNVRIAVTENGVAKPSPRIVRSAGRWIKSSTLAVAIERSPSSGLSMP